MLDGKIVGRINEGDAQVFLEKLRYLKSTGKERVRIAMTVISTWSNSSGIFFPFFVATFFYSTICDTQDWFSMSVKYILYKRRRPLFDMTKPPDCFDSRRINRILVLRRRSYRVVSLPFSNCFYDITLFLSFPFLTLYGVVSVWRSVMAVAFCLHFSCQFIQPCIIKKMFWCPPFGAQVSPWIEAVLVPRTKFASQYPGVFIFTNMARMMRPVKNLRTNSIEYIGSFEQVLTLSCIRLCMRSLACSSISRSMFTSRVLFLGILLLSTSFDAGRVIKTQQENLSMWHDAVSKLTKALPTLWKHLSIHRFTFG